MLMRSKDKRKQSGFINCELLLAIDFALVVFSVGVSDIVNVPFEILLNSTKRPHLLLEYFCVSFLFHFVSFYGVGGSY